jgi:hypothetical protein
MSNGWLNGMEIRGTPGISMDIHRWISMDIHGISNPWISMDIHVYPCISMDIQGWSVQTAPERGVNMSQHLRDLGVKASV